MNKSQVNKKNMIEATLAYLDENVLTCHSVAKLVALKTKLSQISEAIKYSAEAQSNAKATIGQTKVALKKSISAKADVLNDLLEVHASMEGNDELARQMSDTKSDLLKLSYNELVIRVKTIITNATIYKEVLTSDYGMTEEQLTDLQNDVDHLLEISDQPRAYQVKRSVATIKIEELIDEADNLLNNQMDKIMSIFKRRDANFYNGYQKARVIVDY